MIKIGIDIGSTAAKYVVMNEDCTTLISKKILPTGWNSKSTAETIKAELIDSGYDLSESFITSTGYGRISVPFSNKVLTEITCHGAGARYVGCSDRSTIIDIGGQDTKIITLNGGVVNDFLMNDKCSAGTGRFLEIMADSMGLSIDELFDLGAKGKPIVISSTCTVFAESEVVSLVGKGTPSEDIARGCINSVISRVVTQASRMGANSESYFLTGGFSCNEFLMNEMEKKLKKPVYSHDLGRFAGAIGAALLGK